MHRILMSQLLQMDIFTDRLCDLSRKKKAITAISKNKIIQNFEDWKSQSETKNFNPTWIKFCLIMMLSSVYAPHVTISTSETGACFWWDGERMASWWISSQSVAPLGWRASIVFVHITVGYQNHTGSGVLWRITFNLWAVSTALVKPGNDGLVTNMRISILLLWGSVTPCAHWLAFPPHSQDRWLQDPTDLWMCHPKQG